MLLEYLEQITEAQTIEELWSVHVDEMAKFGLNRLIYGFTRYRTAKSFGDQQDLLVLTNHDPVYAEKFMNDGLYFNAPMVKWAAENVGACSWSWMATHSDALTPTEMEVVNYNKKMGITVGYSISFKDVSVRAKGAIGLCSHENMSQAELDKMWEEHGRTIVQMNNVAHLKIINLPYTGSRKTLTARQREVLEWVGDGKTTQDITTIMGLTAATVEKHLRLAREALDVETTAQAVLKASFQNQIFVLEA